MGRKKALVIGINEYEDSGFERLKYAESDARAVYEVLINPDIGDFKKEDVALLLGESKSKIEENLETTLGEAKKDDSVFIYFAGHGKLDKSGDLCLAPRNTKTDRLLATSIHLEHVRRIIDQSDCRRIVFVIDSCFSGAVGQAFRSGDVPAESLEQISGQGKVIISASQAFERARERDDIGHGIFTYSLVKGLEGEADQDGDGYISVDELYRYVCDKVKADTKGQQVPMKWGMDEKGEIIIAKSLKNLEKKRAEVERLSGDARELRRQGRLDESLGAWDKVLQIDPKNAEAPQEIRQIKEEKRERAELEARIDKLFDYYKKGSIPGTIYNKAVGIIKNPHFALSSKEEIFARLVEDLLSNSLTVENFVLSWNRIEKPESQPETEGARQEQEGKVQTERQAQEEEAERLEKKRRVKEEEEKAAREESERKVREKAAREEAERKAREEESTVRTDGIGAFPWMYGIGGGLIALVLVIGLWKWTDSQNAEDFIKRLKEVAEAGNVEKMNKLGVMYEFGEGVEKDYKEAAYWYEKSAESGNAWAMSKLGMMYEEGLGVEKDYDEAARWYEKAASLGSVEAKIALEKSKDVEVPTIQPPEILSFSAEPSTIKKGESSTLSWETSNAKDAGLLGMEKVSLSGSKTVSPAETTTYYLSARNEAGDVESEVTVEVAAEEIVVLPPEVIAFGARPSTINKGEKSTLSWQTSNAAEAQISGIGKVEPSGSKTVSPAETTAYTLIAMNEEGETVEKNTIVKVNAPEKIKVNTPLPLPKISGFEAVPGIVKEGEASTLSWKTLNANEVTLNGKRVSSSGSLNVQPEQTVTYTLVAKSEEGKTVKREVAVEIVKPPELEPPTQDMVRNPERYIRITDWSFFVAFNGVAMISHVEIENTSDIAYKNVEIRVSYYSGGIEVSGETKVLPVTLPPRSKETYLRQGFVLGGGSGDMRAGNIRVLGAIPSGS